MIESLGNLKVDWVGVTIESQEDIDEKLPSLLNTTGIRFVVINLDAMKTKINLLQYLGGNVYKCECGWHNRKYNIDPTDPAIVTCNTCLQRVTIFRGVDLVFCLGQARMRAWENHVRMQCEEHDIPIYNICQIL